MFSNALVCKGAPPARTSCQRLVFAALICGCVQDFPAEEPGVYYNVSTLGVDFGQPSIASLRQLHSHISYCQ